MAKKVGGWGNVSCPKCWGIMEHVYGNWWKCRQCECWLRRWV